MRFTQIPNRIERELDRLKKEPYDPQKCLEHPSYFAFHMLGITPYKYQHQILRRFRDNQKIQLKNDRIMVCKPRQIGISICVAILAIWYAFFNKAKTGPHKDTKVGIISRSDDQAKKLMTEIKKLLFNSPKGISKFIKKEKTPFNKKELHFDKGFIKCFPPTDASRGETFDIGIVDEASFVDDEIFRDVIEPTISAVDGKIILSSTPNGQKGFFYELFDPFGIHKKHEYKRYWFNWKMCENPVQKKIIMQKQKFAKRSGNLKSFEQEYEAQFTSDEEAFFEDADVEKGIDSNLTMEIEEHDKSCAIGIDYGGSDSQTVISVVRNNEKTKAVELINQFAQVNFDENLLRDENFEFSILSLKKRYNVIHIVGDDCPKGDTMNKWMENEGYPLIRFNFRSDQFMGERNRGYYVFRSALKNHKVKYPNIKKLTSEMKIVQETKVDNGKYTKIKAPRGYLCDRIDSLVMACYPFLKQEDIFNSILVDYEAVEKRINKTKISHDGRFDKEWDEITSTEGDYDFLLKKRQGRPEIEK